MGISIAGLRSRLASQGSAGWKDNFANLTAAATGSGAPSLQPFGPSGNAKQRRFGIGDSVYVVWHIDHDVQPESICHVHVHWATDGADTNTVKWEINYTFAKGHDQEAFSTDAQVTLEEAASGTAWQHMITEDNTGFNIPEVDSLVVAEVRRITNGGTNNLDDVFGLFVDIHYQSDREHTYSRSPNFYGG